MWTPRTIWPAPPGASCSLITSISNCMSFLNPAGVRMAKFFGSSSRLISTMVALGGSMGPRCFTLVLWMLSVTIGVSARQLSEPGSGADVAAQRFDGACRFRFVLQLAGQDDAAGFDEMLD